MDVYDRLDDAQKEHKQDQGRRLPRGAAGASYENPAHLLDAENYIKHVWDAVSSTIIINAFKKAEDT